MNYFFKLSFFLIIVFSNQKLLAFTVATQANNIPTNRFAIPLSSLQSNHQNDLMIPMGQKVIIDTSINVRQLMIHGDLYCPRSVGKFKIMASSIMIMGGKLICGSEDIPFSGG